MRKQTVWDKLGTDPVKRVPNRFEGKIRNDKNEGHSPVISKELWDKVQERKK